MMRVEDVFSKKLEKIFGNLLGSREIRIRIDDRGIYWGSRYRGTDEHFLSFTKLDDTPLLEVMNLVVARNGVKSGSIS